MIRCFGDEGDHRETFFHPEPFLDADYDVLVVQRVEWAPLEPLKRIFSEIEKKAKIVYVVHERRLQADPLFYEFHWDAIVCFDKRYRAQWVRRFDDDNVHLIPYPTGHLQRGDKEKARRELHLPFDRRIVLSFGWAPELHVFPVLPALEKLNKRLPFLYLVLAHPQYIQADIQPLERHAFIELRHELATIDRIYAYLHASDAFLMHKEKEEVQPGEAVVPSSILMCMGALTPTVTADTEFVWFFDKEVMKYSNEDELSQLLINAFNKDESVGTVLKSSEEYVVDHSPGRIAGEFIKLFGKLLAGVTE